VRGRGRERERERAKLNWRMTKQKQLREIHSILGASSRKH